MVINNLKYIFTIKENLHNIHKYTNKQTNAERKFNYTIFSDCSVIKIFKLLLFPFRLFWMKKESVEFFNFFYFAWKILLLLFSTTFSWTFFRFEMKNSIELLLVKKINKNTNFFSFLSKNENLFGKKSAFGNELRKKTISKKFMISVFP